MPLDFTWPFSNYLIFVTFFFMLKGTKFEKQLLAFHSFVLQITSLLSFIAKEKQNILQS